MTFESLVPCGLMMARARARARLWALLNLRQTTGGTKILEDKEALLSNLSEHLVLKSLEW